MPANPIAAYRAANSLTQAQLAAYLGVDPMTISRWERGVHRPPRSVMLALSREPVGTSTE